MASDYLSGDLADRSRRMTKAYEDYTQLRVLRQPLAGVYLSFFLMVTLLILVSSTWMGFYLAKRITRPVQMLSVAAREIGQGRYDQRIEHQATDEFGSMIEAFNTMAAELASSRRRLERAAIDLERKNQEVGRPAALYRDHPRAGGDRRRVDRSGRPDRHGQLRGLRGCSMSTPDVVGRPAVDVFRRADLQPHQSRARPGGAREVGRLRAGGCGRPRGPRIACGRGRHAADERGRRLSKARCWCSTTSRRSFARKRWRRGAKWRGGWRMKSRIR